MITILLMALIIWAGVGLLVVGYMMASNSDILERGAPGRVFTRRDMHYAMLWPLVLCYKCSTIVTFIPRVAIREYKKAPRR